MSNLTLTLDFDMPTALRLARYEVESGSKLGDLLVSALEDWEESRAGIGVEPSPASRTVPVVFVYRPRALLGAGYVTRGLYDRRRHEIEITDTAPEISDLRGRRGTPSATAIWVVEKVNPGVIPNRNGKNVWKEVSTGRTVGDLIRDGL